MQVPLTLQCYSNHDCNLPRFSSIFKYLPNSKKRLRGTRKALPLPDIKRTSLDLGSHNCHYQTAPSVPPTMHLHRLLLLPILAISGIMAAPVANSGTISKHLLSTFLSLTPIQMPCHRKQSSIVTSTKTITPSVETSMRTYHISFASLIQISQAPARQYLLGTRDALFPVWEMQW